MIVIVGALPGNVEHPLLLFTLSLEAHDGTVRT